MRACWAPIGDLPRSPCSRVLVVCAHQPNQPAQGATLHPYANLDDKSFWAKAVTQRNMFDIAEPAEGWPS